MENSSVVARLVPHPAVVAGDDAEAVVAGRKVRILRLAVVDHLPPVAILALQLVLEMDLLRRDQAQRGVVDLQIANPRRQTQVRTAAPGKFANRVLPSALTCSMCTGGGSLLKAR